MDRASLIGLTHYKNKDGIIVIEAPTVQKANEYVSEILNKYSDSKTALFLSGGTTPKKLYEHLALQKSLRVGSIGLVDERFGEKLHKNSNELMIKKTGLLEYFDGQNIRFYPILEDSSQANPMYNGLMHYTENGEVAIEKTTKDYDEALRFIFKYFPKSVGILGLGTDGHTAGLPAGNQKAVEIVRKMLDDQSSLVSYYELEGYGARITMNFNALSMLDLIIILVLGQEKREILAQMFKNSGSLTDEDIKKFPTKFYLKPQIAAKTILITDQIV